MADYTVDTFQDYVETLCERHTEVQHNVNGKRAFARFQSEEQLQQLATNAGKNIVVMTHFYGRAVGSIDEKALRLHASISFSSKAKNTTTAEIDGALQRAWNILWDFVARMREDAQNEENCGPLEGIELQNISFNPLDPFLEFHHGWELIIPFKTTQPQYDAAKWIE